MKNHFLQDVVIQRNENAIEPGILQTGWTSNTNPGTAMAREEKGRQKSNEIDSAPIHRILSHPKLVSDRPEDKNGNERAKEC
jgi:hypothetical protein